MRYKQSLFLDVLMVALSAFFLVHAILFWRDIYFTEDKAVTEVKKVNQRVDKAPVDKEGIIHWDPFGVKPPDKPKKPINVEPVIKAQPKPKPVVTNQPIETKLQLQLLGTILDKQNSVAFITKERRETDVFQVGDTIIPGVKLMEIQLHKVIVDNRGRSEIILEQGYDATLDKLLSTEGANFQEGSNQGLPTQDSAPSKFEITPVDGNVYVTQKEVRRQVKNLSGLLSQVRVQPVFSRNNRSQGFKILHVNQGSFIEALGLRTGDTIRAINGTVVDSMQKGYELFNKLQAETSVDVEIIRNNQNQKIHFEMRN